MPVPLYLDVHVPLAIAERFTGIGRWVVDLENAVQHLPL
jgi:hypothetical protein